MRSSYLVAAGALALLGGLLWLGGPNNEPSSRNSHSVTVAGNSAGVPRFFVPRAKPSIASLPDRGNLVAFDPTSAPRRRSAYIWHAVSLSEEHAIHAIATGEMTVAAPDGRSVRLKYVRHLEHPDGNWTWIGRPEGTAPGIEAIITFGEKAVFGSIPQGDRPPLRVTTASGRTWMMDTDPRLLATLDDAVVRPRGPDTVLPPVSRVHPPAASADALPALGAQGMPVAAATGSADNTVDVLLGYTSAFASRLGGRSQALTRLNYIVDVANQAYANSQIAAQVRLVAAVEVSYPDATKNETALYELTGVDCSGTNCVEIPVPASLLPLHAARDQYGADLVALVRDFDEAAQGGCGIAWVIGGEQTAITTADEYAGFSVVSDTNGTDPRFSFPSNSQVCRDEALAHELGHNMGSVHDRTTAAEADDSNGDGNMLDPDEYGRYPYSFGYRTNSPGNFYTVMAYRENPSSQQQNRVFSNPQISTCGPQGSQIYPCGVADQADNARSLRNTIPIIASFRASVVGRSHSRDLNGDGRDDIFWSNRALQQADWWLMNGPAWSYAGSMSVPTQYFVAGRGDFNGDGRGDILWEDGSTIWLWQGGTSGFSVHFVANHPRNGWVIAGVGDFNGDGRDDIFWSNRALQQADWWLMNGAAWSYAGSKGVPGQYRVAGIGDFNGDKRADVLWEDGDTLWNWQAEGNGFGVYFISTFPANGWSIAGTGDFDGDGASDIFWSNRTIGQADWWLMKGATLRSIASKAVPSQYRVAMLGDFDGDGRDDVLWEDGSTIWIWDAEPSGFDIKFVSNYPAGAWVITH